MKRIQLICLFFFPGICCHTPAQKSLYALNAVFAEFGGNGLFYSINYDRLLYVEKKIIPAIRGGVYYEQFASRLFRFTFPVEFSFIKQIKNNHFAEAGTGFTWRQQSMPQVRLLFPVVRLGYRYQQNSGGLFIKAGFTPFLPPLVFDYPAEYQRPGFKWMAGFAVGYSFASLRCTDC